MASNSDVGITLIARTDEFEARLKRATGTFENFALKGKDVSASFDASIRQLSIKTKGYVDDIERAFNSLQIKPDISLEKEARLLQENVKFYERQFNKIATDAKSSTSEVTRAFVAMNDSIRQVLEQPLKSSYSTLGLLPTTSIEAEKAKIISAFEAIRDSGISYPNDIARAHEKMVEEISRLDSLYLTNSEKVYDQAFAINQKFNEARIASDRKVYDAKIAAEKANLLAYEEAENEAFALDQKFNQEREATRKAAVEREIADINLLIRYRQQQAAKQAAIGEANAKKEIAAQKELAEAKKVALETQNAPYKALGILPTSTIDADKAKIVAAFEQIKSSGTASANDVKRAYAAMNLELDRLNKLGSVNSVKEVEKGFNLMSLASAAAIVKIQILYSLVNQTMSFIGSLPSMAIDAVESFNSAAISNAAIIVSMQKNVKDVGKAYQDAKSYAEDVQRVLIQMDPMTAASGKNLNDMNTKFIQQGVLIDANNKKQKEGFLAIANALSALTKQDANANLQYPQEISALLRGENRPSNKLFQTVNALDNGMLKEHLELWKKTAQETGNYGLILEKLGPLLKGFQSAQVDINALWETQKSTLTTIRDEILRDGFGPEYKLIVKNFTQFNEYLEAHKNSISNFLKSGFEDVNVTIDFVKKYKTELEIVVGSVVAFKLAQIALNFVLKENPYVILVIAIAALNNELEKSGTSILGLAKNWSSSAIDIVSKFDSIKSTGEGTVKFLTNAFEEFPENVRAFIGIMTVEVASGFDKAMAYATAFKDQAKAVFGDSGDTTNYFDRVAKGIDVINKARLLSIDDILKERQTALDSYKQQTKAAADLKNKLAEHADYGGNSKVPTGLDFSVKDENANAKIMAAQKLMEKQAALEKSYNAIKLADNENARKLDLQNDQNDYDAKIISLKAYVEKKQNIEVAAALEKVKINKDTVAAAQKVLDEGNYGITGDKGESDKGETAKLQATIKLNEAIKSLHTSEGDLAVLRAKNSGELAKYQRDEEDHIKQIQIVYESQFEHFSTAEKLRQSTIAVTSELFRLQQDVIEAVTESEKKAAQSALDSYKATLEATQNLAAVKEKFNNIDINNTKFGNNAYDSVTDKYINMYKKISEAQASANGDMTKANNLMWGANVNMVSDSMDTISGILMKGNEEQFAIGKAFAISSAIINGALGVTKAFASLPPPYSFVVAGMIAVATGAQIGTIAGQQYQARADGGPVVAGQTYLVNENRNTQGPEYFTPGVSGVITPANKIGGGGGTIINIHNAPAGTKTKRRDDGNGKEVIDIVIADMQTDGPISRTMGARFGMQRYGT